MIILTAVREVLVVKTIIKKYCHFTASDIIQTLFEN